MKRIAIYSRKSKFTGVGDSIENQIQLCKDYAKMHFGSNEDNMTIFEDEGFSGSTTNRPQFQMLLQEVKQKKFDVLICYRLDRISRSIADFATLIEDLQEYDIAFVSIKEQFDTSTPMGRAMMYIASVFAQLERETIAERIRDNLQQLAKTGRWLGGTTPTGYESKEVIIVDSEGKKRKAHKLTIVESEAEQIKDIFKKFLELKTISKLLTYCIQNDIKSKNGCYYTRHTLRGIIENPVYAIADETICEYLRKQNHKVYSEEGDFDGKRGLMAYNKTNQSGKGSRFNDDGWSISVGYHEGIISSKDWIKSYELRVVTKDVKIRKRHNANALLSGLLICEACGSFMRKGGVRTNKDGTVAFYYICELKEQSKKHKCNTKNIRGDKLDEMIIDELRQISLNDSDLSKKINNDKVNVLESQKQIDKDVRKINRSISKNDKSISNLIKALSEGEESLASKYIIKQINDLEEDNVSLKEDLLTLNKSIQLEGGKESQANLVQDMLMNFTNIVDHSSDDKKKELIRIIVDKILWDGKNIDIILFGTNS